jgi:site-specific DNA-methyltransferase (adenine-specific)
MAGLSKGLFTSDRMDWETPADLFSVLHREFAFTRDVCARPGNAKCAAYFSPVQDALRHVWTGRCWMNPPYGRAVGRWVAKAWCASRRGATVVALLPVRTDTAWWQDIVMRAREIRFLRGRLRFVGASASAPFPSAVVVFAPGRRRRASVHVRAWNWRAITPRQSARPIRLRSSDQEVSHAPTRTGLQRRRAASDRRT